MTKLNCEECKGLLIDLVDGSIADDTRAMVNEHIDDCDVCSSDLTKLWDLQMMASRWQDEHVPDWKRRDFFFETRTYLPALFPALQVTSAFASVLVLVLVLVQAQISTADGFEVRFGNSYALTKDVDSKLTDLKNDLQMSQEGQLKVSVDRLTNQQIASNQLLLRTILQASRSERREELQNLLVLLEETQSQRYQQTEASLQYLVETQIEDRRNIKTLGQAVKLMASDGGTL